MDERDYLLTFLRKCKMGHCDVVAMEDLLCKYAPEYTTTAPAIRQEPEWLMDHLPPRWEDEPISWTLMRSCGEWIVARQVGHRKPRLWTRDRCLVTALQEALLHCAAVGDYV